MNAKKAAGLTNPETIRNVLWMNIFSINGNRHGLSGHVINVY